ncbi:MFS transporter [Arthrobacter sp. NEB 688]|uniref:MFS transporter n=1 Tax=Arthrobacter sp. NEB 688 TaxID=904039 RepID=UPI001566AB3B|nr:MFS transporter [Arthrobacter sp. NEB 688]QKE83400.1 MFS transporter [Arthrobacter sp. NEB 688]
MPQPRHASLATFALILGGIAIGTTEFVTMGLLPDIAYGVDVSIPTAGHAISAYAAGVVVGAPLIAALGATLPRKGLLVGLMVAFAVGNALSALAPGYETLVGARFLAGLPHGAYFGVAALVAVDLAPPGRAGRAVGTVMLGIPVANVLGVPGATWLGQTLGWRSAYWLVAVLGLLTVALVLAQVPHLPGDRSKTVRSELGALTNLQVLLTLAVGAVGFGGMFAMYSYIAPTVTDVTGLPASAVPLFLLVFGVAGFVGNLLAGRMGDWSVLRSVVIGMVGLGISLGLFALVAQWVVPALLVLALTSVLASVLVINLQLRLMQVAGKAQTLAAAGNHAALNLANALGAWLGGVVIARGYGYTAPSWVGVGLSVLGLAVLGVSLLVHERTAPWRRPGRRAAAERAESLRAG